MKAAHILLIAIFLAIYGYILWMLLRPTFTKRVENDESWLGNMVIHEHVSEPIHSRASPRIYDGSSRAEIHAAPPDSVIPNHSRGSSFVPNDMPYPSKLGCGLIPNSD